MRDNFVTVAVTYLRLVIYVTERLLRRKPLLVGYRKLDKGLKWLIALTSQKHKAAQVAH